jgi:maleate isomerase
MHGSAATLPVTTPARGRQTGSLTQSLAHSCRELLTWTAADRVTVRADLPTKGLHVDRPAAEARQEGVASLLADASMDQRGLETIQWLDLYRTTLVQCDFREPPFPPPALIETYGVQAQMLGPLVVGGALLGWVSVHQCHERDWSGADVEALRSVMATITERVQPTWDEAS